VRHVRGVAIDRKTPKTYLSIQEVGRIRELMTPNGTCHGSVETVVHSKPMYGTSTEAFAELKGAEPLK